MTYTYKILSVDLTSGTFVVQFDGQPALNYLIPHNESGYLTGDALDSAIQQMYPQTSPHSQTIANFTNGAEIEALVQQPVPTAESIRQKRDFLLITSDWTQNTDSPLSAELKSAWSTYRQTLRNIPEQTGFPTNITFPLIPN